VTSSALSVDGIYLVKARQTDPAGNVSSYSSTLSVTIDTTAPSLSSFMPSDGSTDVAADSNLVLTFDGAIGLTGNGTISIRRPLPNGALIESIPVNSSRVTGSGTATITVNPSLDLPNASEFYVTISSDAFPDAAGNFYAGISSDTTWNFTTSVASATESSSSSSAPSHGGGRGGGSAPATSGPATGVTTSVIPSLSVPHDAPSFVQDIVRMRDRLVTRIEKRIAENPAVKDALLRMLDRLDKRILKWAGR
jgi:hypothetical protein